uniref:STI1 domain-containing protein n=1 Tax=Brassica campestris TaxID=3711 RepID=M4D8Y7_BRACM
MAPLLFKGVEVQLQKALIRHNKPGVTAFKLDNGYAGLIDALASDSVDFYTLKLSVHSSHSKALKKIQRPKMLTPLLGSRGIQDPVIQNILTVPVMGQIMSDFQENPPTAQKHMQIPMIMKKYKIISAQDFQENPPNGSVADEVEAQDQDEEMVVQEPEELEQGFGEET